MHNQDPNNYWEQLERLEKLIRASELKAGVLFSFHSLIIGLFVDRLEEFKHIIEGDILLFITIICWIITVMISIFYCFLCFRPRIEMKYSKNVFFFRDAVNKFGNLENYTKTLIETCGSTEKLYEQLSEQIHAESKIINEKFKSVSTSIKFFGISFVFVILIVFIVALKI